jgi:iron complex transport system ATP-binding protein
MTILELLRASADRGMTVLLVTHGLDMAARFADRMLVLSRGRVAAEGRPEEVMTAGIIEDVYRWPVSVETNPISLCPRVTPLRSGGAP